MIKILRSASVEELRLEAESRGFVFKGIHHIEDAEYGVIVRDSHRENVVINDAGNVVFIDPLIQFTENSKFVRELVY